MFIQQTGQGTDIFLIHGWGMNHHCWRPLQAALKPHYRLTAVDLPGHGGSINSTASFCRPQALIEELLNIAPANAIWVGWSLGGLLAQIAVSQVAVAEAPNPIQCMMSISMGARFTTTHDWSSGTPVTSVEQMQQQLTTNPTQCLHSFIRQQVQPGEHQEQTISQLNNMIQTPYELEELQAGLELLKVADCRAEMSEYHGQALYISGEYDTVCHPSAVKQSAALCQHSHCAMISGAGHAPLLSHPRQIAQLLERLLFMQK